MRLLKLSACGELSLTPDLIEDIPPYAILSHTWEEDNNREVTFKAFSDGSGKSKAGYTKIKFCGERATRDGLQHFWVDTCCIDKSNDAELSEAIRSMFRWYRDADKCYVYLSDVSAHTDNNQTEKRWKPAFRKSRWFRRGWTLQELIAPESVEFFSREGELLGSKNTLEQLIHEITEIPIEALHRGLLTDFSVDERMRWAAKRTTKRREDKAYCLLGIFDVHIPLLYGEGDNAFIRLQEEIDRRSSNRLETKAVLNKHDEAIKKSLSDLQATDPGLDMKRIQNSKDPLLKDCYEWVFQDPIFRAWQSNDTRPVLWIKGDPGKGKTMLMIAMVRELSTKIPGVVTFFFCQSTDPRINNATSILRGLIWKLAMDRPQLARLFHENHERNKHMFNGTNAIYALFSTLSAMLNICGGAVLVDALDECDPGKERDDLLKLITEHAKSSSNTKWLLSSRNNPDIKQLLEQESLALSLELNELHISQAVSAFIEHKTDELAKTKKYSLDLKEQVKTRLITKSDSTFLWVALACKSLLKVTRWKTLSELENMPPKLKDLYMQMLEQILKIEDEEERLFCLQTLRSVSLGFRPLSITELITIAGLPMELLEGDGLSDIIELCGSFIILRHGFLYFIHQSAKEYFDSDGIKMVSPTGLQNEHSLIVNRSLNVMSKTFKRDICNLGHPGSLASTAIISPYLEAISYSCCFWVDHLAIYLGDDPNTLCYEEYLLNQGQIHQFLCKHLLHWFEALSLIKGINRGIIGLYSLERMIRKLPPKISQKHRDFVQDAIQVLRQFRPAVEEAPLQAYCSVLIFSPDNSIVRQNFKQDRPSWISTPPRIPKEWSPCLQTLEGHTDRISSVVYSPDGRQLVSGSGDKTVRLWDAATGACQHTLEGHTDSISSVVYSSGGRQLASGSHDKTVRLWDAATGACQHTLEGHTGWIYSVVYSPDGRQLASGSHDKTVRLWDAATGACQHTLEGHTGSIYSVVYSPDGRQLASGSDDKTVRLWDAATGACQHTLEGHTGSIFSVVYSPDGRQLASGSHDKTVRLWDAATGACQHTLEGHTDSIFSVVYSSDGRQLASGSDDKTVRLWDAATGACQHALEGHIDSVAFSLYDSTLVTDFGVSSIRSTLQADHSLKQIGCGIERERKWITWKGRNILWLPPEYRPTVSAAKESCIAVGCSSGVVYIVNICVNKLPP